MGLLAALFALSLASSSTAVVLGDRPAGAAAGCQGASCTGWFPDEKQCITSNTQQVAWLGFDRTINNETDPIPSLRGNAIIYYSPECRAAFGEFTMTVMDPEDFWPTLFAQPQYGGRKMLIGSRAASFGFKFRDGVADGSNPEVILSAMVDWSSSIRLCLDESHEIDYNPDAEREPLSPIIECLDWQ